MLQSIWDDVRREFSFGNMINRIIIVNVVMFMVVNLMWVFMKGFPGWSGEGTNLYTDLIGLISGSYLWKHMLFKPWTAITYMFVHEGLLHLLFNMLYLFWFGRIFGDLLGDRRVLPLYLMGGLAGFVAFFLAFSLFNIETVNSDLIIGASGAVVCILTATGIFAPDYGINLLFLGTIRLKYIVFFAVFAQVIGLGRVDNIGGTFAHIGGIVMGIMFAFYLRRGSDLTEPFQNGLAWIRNKWNALLAPSKEHPKPGPRAAYRGGRSVKETAAKARPSFMRKAGGTGASESTKRTNAPRSGMTHQEELDAILDKIKDKGYNSLTKEEKDFLFRASNEK